MGRMGVGPPEDGISNIEHRISNVEGKTMPPLLKLIFTSVFDIRCSTFDILCCLL